MQLTLYTDYSLRVLMYLASHNDRRVTITEMADAYQISRNHLVKVVHQLSQNGWITTIRGKSGGMHLAFPPEQINIGTVVRQTEPHMNLLECFDKENNQCSISPVCHLKRILYQARRAFNEVLDQHSLADALGAHSAEIINILDASILQANQSKRDSGKTLGAT
ncbi:MAG TPA: Rrf2 family transcriptional regulator [Mariprofundaceae bacterium]|nr:Rrf2 family transcriptional regulator [Mariprofundaceae bacterium]